MTEKTSKGVMATPPNSGPRRLRLKRPHRKTINKKPTPRTIRCFIFLFVFILVALKASSLFSIFYKVLPQEYHEASVFEPKTTKQSYSVSNSGIVQLNQEQFQRSKASSNTKKEKIATTHQDPQQELNNNQQEKTDGNTQEESNEDEQQQEGGPNTDAERDSNTDEEGDFNTDEEGDSNESGPERAQHLSDKNELELRKQDDTSAFKDEEQTINTHKIAYAFFLGGIPNQSNDNFKSAFGRTPGTRQPAKDDYRGFLYNIMVSVKVLKDSGSRADFILLVHMAEPNTTLPPDDVRMLQELGVKIKYTPPTPDVINEIITVPLEKFRVLDLIEYARVLYMDADVTPRCNLDYIMELSMGPNAILQKNFLISIFGTPASAKFFMLTPGPGELFKFIQNIAARSKTSGSRAGFQPAYGWGTGPYFWKALNGNNDTEISFKGGNNDQGLLFHYAKYTKQSVSIAVGDTIENWSYYEDPTKTPSEMTETLGRLFEQRGFLRGGRFSPQAKGIINRPFNANQLLEHSCSPAEDENLNFHSPNYSPKGVAPYRDFIQWDLGDTYPWNMKETPTPDNTQSKYAWWFDVLRQLDGQLKIGLGLQDTTKQTEWRFIPKSSPAPFHSMWSDGVKALRQWANRLNEPSDGYLSWEAPTFIDNTTNASMHDETSLLSQCNCQKSMKRDLCSIPGISIKEWLSDKLPYHLSKQRPLCPGSLYHDMHVLLSSHGASLEDLQDSVCSVACQKYPAGKISIYVYDDGSADNFMDDVCKNQQLHSFTPSELPQSSKKVKGKGKQVSPIPEDSLKEHARNSMKTIMESRSLPKSGPSLVCIRSEKQLGAAGSNYWAFRMVESVAGPNDVLVLIEDGQFHSTDALAIINNKYTAHNALTTYGSHAGDVGPVNDPIPEKRNQKFSPRKDKPEWVFGGPRSFKVLMLQSLSLGVDFVHKDGSWLVDSANRGYVYTILERAQQPRISYISEPIFKLRKGEPSETSGKHVFHMKNLKTMGGSSKLKFPATMVMVCPKNLELLGNQLHWLQMQSLAKKRTLILHLLYDASVSSEQLEGVVNKFREKQQEGSYGMVVRLKIVLVLKENQANAFSRFEYARDLRGTEPLDSVILLDNDQYWMPDFISSILDRHQGSSMTSWEGHLYSKYNPETGFFDYGNPSALDHRELVSGLQPQWTSFVSSEHGGAIFDANLVLFDKLFQGMQNECAEYTQADSVWVSYVLDALLGWEMHRFVEKIPVISISRCHEEVYTVEMKNLQAKLPVEVREKLLELNKHIATESTEARLLRQEQKNQLFLKLQRHYHWNVLRNHEMPRWIPDSETVPTAEVETFGVSRHPVQGNRPGKDRAFICVTGQFERFELKNKISKFFEPLRSGFELDVAFALSSAPNGTAAFTNAKSKRSDTVPFYTRFEDVLKDLKKSKVGANLLTRNGTYPLLADPRVPIHYAKALYEAQRPARTLEEQKLRAKNHARIFDSYRRCLQHADEEAKAAGSTLEEYYSVFIRIRDDVGMKGKMDKDLLQLAFPPPARSIVVTECRSWHGMNDRFAIVSPEIARDYFNRPLEILTSKVSRIYDLDAVRNPESYLLYTYTIVKFHVLGFPGLQGLTRMYKKADGGSKFLLDDIRRERCPKPDPHRDRNYGLYGWVL